MKNRTRLPVTWMPPAALESAIEGTRSGTERHARTTAVAITAAAQNGTSRRAHQPAIAYIESDVRTSDSIIPSRRSVRSGLGTINGSGCTDGTIGNAR
jgi:hypothetical protein